MGKFGIGARVRDADGDLAEVIGKPEKGYRELRIHGGKHDGMTYWAPNGDLEVAPESIEGGSITVDFGKAEIRIEAGESVFAVGDRVVMVQPRDGEFSPVVARIISDDGQDYLPLQIEFEGEAAFGHGTPATWYVDPSDIARFTIEAGKLYRTRDGRKVGPMEVWTDGCGELRETYSREQVAAFVAPNHPMGGSYTADGIWLTSNGRDENDIVSEWVGPAAETIVVEDATDPVWQPAVGDKTRRTKNPYVFVPIGFESTIKLLPSGILGYVDAEGDSLQFYDDRWELVTTVEPQPKFKVGDRVNYTLSDEAWQGVTITQVPEYVGGIYIGTHPKHGVGGFYEDQIVAAPADLYIGKAVTAAGHISGANGDNFSVVFANSNRSYDLPATALRAA